MITRYLTSLTATFNPLSPHRSHKIPRLVLAFLSPDARSPSGENIKVETKVLPASSKDAASLILNFKDGRKLTFKEGKSTRTPTDTAQTKDKQTAASAGLAEGEWDLRRLGVKDVVEEADRHSRALRRKEELSGER